MIKGVFLYYPEATAYTQRIQAAKDELELDIKMVKATFETVSNLIPYHLQYGAKAWLILCEPDYEQELLILPIFDENQFVLLREFRYFRFFESIAGLLHQFSYFRKFPHFRPFESLYIDTSLDSLLNPRGIERPEGQETVQSAILLFQQRSQYIQEKRTENLRQAAQNGDFSFLDKDELDNVLSKVRNELFEFIRRRLPTQVVPKIATDFEGIIDPTTKRFLITAETVGKFAKKYSPVNFDYSAPGCGLWKAVERELNLSLILHLRRSEGVITNVYHPWKKSADARKEFLILKGKNASEDLSKTKGSKNFKGIMLGDMGLMLQWEHCNTVREKFENLPTLKGKPYLPTSFTEDLKTIKNLRNGHAHISAMSEQEFNQLCDLVLPSRKKASACLLEILQLKKAIFDYWKREGDRPTYVTTTDHECVDFSAYNETKVIRSGKSTWKLVAIHGNGTQLRIANFNDKNAADTALASLDEAVATHTEKKWDANEATGAS